MKQRQYIIHICVIAASLAAPAAWADIMWDDYGTYSQADGPYYQLSAGPVMSFVHNRCDADYWSSIAGASGWQSVYTTEGDTFDWGFQIYGWAYAELHLWDNEMCEADAWTEITVEAPQGSSGYDRYHLGHAYQYDYGEGKWLYAYSEPIEYPGEYVVTQSYVGAMDGVTCSNVALVLVQTHEGGDDTARGYAETYAEPFMWEPQ